MVETIGDFLNRRKDGVFNYIFENASNLIIIVNEKFEIEYCNKEPHYQLLGYNPKEVIGKSPLDFIHPKERNYIIKNLNKVFEGIEEKIEIRLKHKENNYKWFEINGRRIVDHLGITRIILISKEIFKYKKIKNLLRKRDIDKKSYNIYDSITELSFWKLFQPKQFKVALEKSYEMLEFVINNIPQYIAWKDKNLVYLGCNFNFAQKISVKNPINIIGKTDLDFFLDEKEIKASIKKERRILELGQPEFHVIESWSDANGEKRNFDTNRIPLYDNEGNVVGILVTFEDITDRNKA
ncbi:MAG: PAS domain-containing protein, partial [Promethearchaeota archaeon]